MLDATARNAVEPPVGVPELSLLGGPLHRLARWLKRGSDLAAHARLGVVLALLAWLPLMLLALWGGGALPTVGAHVRLLLAIPLLLVSEARIDPQFAALGVTYDPLLTTPDEKRYALHALFSSF